MATALTLHPQSLCEAAVCRDEPVVWHYLRLGRQPVLKLVLYLAFGTLVLCLAPIHE